MTLFSKIFFFFRFEQSNCNSFKWIRTIHFCYLFLYFVSFSWISIHFYCWNCTSTSCESTCVAVYLNANQSSKEDSCELMFGIEWNLWQCCCIVDDSDVMFLFLCLFVHSREFSANYIWDERQSENIQCFFIWERKIDWERLSEM